MANLKTNEPKPQNSGLLLVVILFFVILGSPLFYFMYHLMMGNEAMFIYNPYK
ncbi:hypothetical protein [Paenibacillus elgii]|uniref:hypothetical protein n=1 Tax=Paenibacillus elgii TaxID=189691 RepID=UPI000248CB13|nr:hypothetical protein [Paenibacillus elgii]